MSTPIAAEAPLPRLTRFEIGAHGLAIGIGSYCAVSGPWNEDWTENLVLVGLPLLVVLLSMVILVRRFRPELRGMRVVELGLSGLVATLGLAGAVATLLFMASGARYKGPSPDAGGMAVFAGFVVFYPCASLIFVPFALNASRLSPRLRRRLGWLCLVLVFLPPCVLLAVMRR